MFSNKLMWVAIAIMIIWAVIEVTMKRRDNKKIDELMAKDWEKLKEAERRESQ